MKENEIIDTKELRLVSDIRTIVEQGLQTAYQNVNTVIVLTYWQVGRRIVEEEQNGEARAEYGSKLITLLAEALSTEYARGFSARDLRNYRQLYLCFNDLEIWYTRVPNLTWSHYRTLLSVASDDARYWYVQEASREMWSVRTLARNVGSQYYHRLLQSPKKIDLKTKKVTHQDVGQMDMYVRMFDDLKRTEDDNPTIGLLLCAETSEDIARYSVLHDSKQLFQAKYLTFMPSEEELRREIEQQKELFLLQHNCKTKDE